MEKCGDSEQQLANSLPMAYFSERSRIFRELLELRARGWDNKDADEHFAQQRHRADNADDQARHKFFSMMREIGDEMQVATGGLHIQSEYPDVLDLCMAPGGFTASVLRHNYYAQVAGITLPENEGGHKLMVDRGFQDPRVEVTQLDITMLSSEFGVDEIPEDHPDKMKFLPGKRPYLDQRFNLVFCDGQVLRTHVRSSYREAKEALRLISSQLVLAMQRIRAGATVIMLLHKIEAWNTIKLLFQFNKFASISLFKPVKKHASRSSFYLIARKVDPDHPGAIAAVAQWKADWKEATFNYNKDTTVIEEAKLRDTSEQMKVLDEFGPRLIELAEPIWARQRDALKRAPFMRRNENSLARS